MSETWSQGSSTLNEVWKKSPKAEAQAGDLQPNICAGGKAYQELVNPSRPLLSQPSCV